MAKRKPSNLLARFRQRLTRLEQLRVKEEELYSKGLIALRDIEEIYGMTFLNSVVHFEELIEELFISFLVGKSKPACPEFKVRVSIKSHKVARELLCHDRNYVTWLPYDNTKKKAGAFFRGGRPFTTLTDNEEKHIGKCLIVRNCLAHQGRHAKERFQRKVLSSLSLSPRERQVKSFLRAQFSRTPARTYCEQFLGELFTIASKLC